MGSKKLFFVSLIFCLAFLVSGLSACGIFEDDPSIQPPAVTASVDIEADTYNLKFGDSYTLNIVCQGDEKLSLSSANSEVVVVNDNGVLQAVGIGTTVVTATYGTATDNCTVNVDFGNEIPQLSLTQIDSDNVRVAIGDALYFDGTVTFSNNAYTDVEWNYSSSAPIVGEINSQGEFIAKSKGETDVSVSCVWQGVSLEKTVKVTVGNPINLYVNDGKKDNFTLYTVDNHGGVVYDTETPFVVTAQENGIDVDYEVQVVSGEDVVSYDDNAQRLTALSYGDAKIKIVFPDSDGITYEKAINVKVERPIASYTNGLTEISALDGVDVSILLGANVTIIEAYQGEKTLEIANNIIYGIATESATITETEIIVFSETVGWKIPVSGYTKIIRTAAELYEIFNVSIEDIENVDNPTGGESPSEEELRAKTITGYYVLANDIDASDYTFDQLGMGKKKNSAGSYYYNIYEAGFVGTLDGKGYTISTNVGTYGFFGSLHPNSMVKDVCMELTAVADDASSRGPSAIAFSAKGRLDDCYIRITQAIKTSETSASAPNLQIFKQGALMTVAVVIEYVDYVFDASVSGGLFTRGNVGNLQAVATWIICEENVPLQYTNSKGEITAIYAKNDEQENVTKTTTDLYYVSSWRQIPKDAITGNNWTTFELETGEKTTVWKAYASSVAEVKIDGETTGDKFVLSRGVSANVSAMLFDSKIPTEIEILSGEEFLSVANGEVEGIGLGTAEIKVSYELFGEIYERTISVEISLPTQTIESTVYYSKNDGTIYFNDTDGNVVGLERLFGENYTLTIANAGTSDFLVNENKFTGSTLSEGETMEFSVFVEDRGVKFTNVIVVRQVLNEASDMAVFDFTEERANVAKAADTAWTLDGLYVLLSDLDATSYPMKHLGMNINSFKTKNTCGFVGTLNGNGYTLKVNVGDYGLFGSLLRGCVVENIGLDITVNTYNAEETLTPSLLGVYVKASGTTELTTVSNVYIKGAYATGYSTDKANVVVAGNLGNANFTNVILDWSAGYTYDETKAGALWSEVNSSYSRHSKIFIICANMEPIIKVDGVAYYATNDGQSSSANTANIARVNSVTKLLEQSGYVNLAWQYVEGVWMYSKN